MVIEYTGKIQKKSLWKKFHYIDDKPSPADLYNYYLTLLKESHSEWPLLDEFHPVMTLRTLITNIYNPIRINRFAKVVKEYLPLYYSESKKFRDLINNLSNSSAYDSLLLQWAAYFIIRAFANVPDPKNKQDHVDGEELLDHLEYLVNSSIDEVQNIYVDSDNTILQIFDDKLKDVQSIEIDSIPLPLFPIPGGDLRFFRVFENICKNSKPPNIKSVLKHFSDNTLLHQRGGLGQYNTKNFMPEILPRDFIEVFMDSYYESLEKSLKPSQFLKFEAKEHVYRFLLFEFYLSNLEEINYYEFQSICKKHDIPWEDVEPLILKYDDIVNSNRGLADKEIQKEIPFQLFRKLYSKPLLLVKSDAGKHYRYNLVLFSWPMIFDAYLNEIGHFYKHSSVGKQRGNLLEDSIAQIIQEKLFAEPFKLIIVNKNLGRSHKLLNLVLNQTTDFKYNRIIIKIDPDEVSWNNFHFYELDVCYYYNSRLYFVETKDNLILDTYDHPDLSLKWILVNLKKIRGKEKFLKIPIIKAKIESALNLKIKNIKGLFLSNISFNIGRCFTVGEFQAYLNQIQTTLRYDSVRQKSMEVLQANIRRSEILRDLEKLTAYLKRAFDLAYTCKLWDEANSIGEKLLENIDQTSFYEDKLILSMKLGDVCANLYDFKSALKSLNRAKFNINLKTEPLLGMHYFYKRGLWLDQLNYHEDSLGAFMESERISREIDVESDFFIILLAKICQKNFDIFPDFSLKNSYFAKKLRLFFPEEEDLKNLISEIVQNAPNY
jgi:hypothetical protein